MKVRYSFKRACEVFDPLLARHRANKHPYNLLEARVPHVPENLPPGGFRSEADKAHWFFLLCLFMRGKIKSFTAARNLSRVYSRWPDMFVPGAVAGFSHSLVMDRIVSQSLGFNQKQNAQFWIDNMTRLQDHYEGDVRQVFVGIHSYEELCQRVCNPKNHWRRNADTFGPGFLGFQEKMTSMLAYYLLSTGLIAPLEFPLPVDFHVLRIVLAHEIIWVEGYHGDMFKPAVLAAVRKLSLQYSRSRGATPEEMSELLWCFSTAMCSKHPGNVSMWVGKERNRKAKIVPKPVTWSRAQRESYNLACGQCPVEKTCRHCIPAAPHYNYGALSIRGPRTTPPQQRLFPPVCVVTRESRDWQSEDAGRVTPPVEQQLPLIFEENE